MDKKKRDRVIKIVKAMAKTGKSADRIRNDLRVLKISDAEIDEIMREAGVRFAPAEEVGAKVSEIHEKVREHAGAISEMAEGVEAGRAALRDIIVEFRNVQSQLSQLGDVSIIKRDLDEIKSILLEIKPIVAAVKDLNERLLAINKDMLIRLKK